MCASVKAGENRLDIIDAKSSGLVFRVTPRGVKSWAVLYRRKSDGKRRRYTLGNYPLIGLSDARALAAHVQAQVLAGGDPAGERRAQKAVDTFADLSVRYISRYAKKHKRSWREDQRIIDRELNPVIGGMKINEIRRRTILDLLDHIADRPAPVMANRTLAVVRKIFRWAEEEDLIETAPVHGIKPRAAEKPRERVLDDDEILTLWATLDDLSRLMMTAQIADAIKLCLLLGQRAGEVMQATRPEFDLEAGLWTLPPERTKNKREHLVPLPPVALEIVSRNLEASPSECLFPSPKPDQCQSYQAPNRAIARNLDALGLKKFTCHDLRRTLVTGLARLGIDRLTISKIANHVSADLATITGTTYDKYDYLTEKRRALEAWELHIQNLMSGATVDSNVVRLVGNDSGE